MGLALPTLGADAEFGLLCSGRAAGRLGTPTTPLTAATTATLSAAATTLAATTAGPATLIVSFHGIILLVSDVAFIKLMTSPSAAPGHPKAIVVQPAPAPSLDDLGRLADYIGKDLDAITCNHGQ